MCVGGGEGSEAAAYAETCNVFMHWLAYRYYIRRDDTPMLKHLISWQEEIKQTL